MAVQDSNKRYIKINYEDCHVSRGVVYVSITMYKDKDSRDREKLYGNSFDIFYENALQALNDKEEQLNTLYGENTPEENYSLAISEFEQLNHKKDTLQSIYNHFRTTNESDILILEEEDINYFTTLGFIPEYLNSIIITLHTLINCGPWRSEEPTQEMYYNYLKNIMNSTLDI